jgi:hypothetical protein
MFQPVAQPIHLVRCCACGSVVDASDDGRRIHATWHESFNTTLVDLTAFEEAQTLV